MNMHLVLPTIGSIRFIKTRPGISPVDTGIGQGTGIDRLLIRFSACAAVCIAPADPLRMTQQNLGNLFGMNLLSFVLCVEKQGVWPLFATHILDQCTKWG